MSTWSYCRSCSHPLDRITVEDIAGSHGGAWKMERDKICCPSCGASREDDTPEMRTTILAEAILAARA